MDFLNKKCCKCGLNFNGTQDVLDDIFQKDDKCYYCKSWEIIFRMYRMAFSDNEYWQAVLDNAERVIFNLNPKKEYPDPHRFKRILIDRGVEPGNREMGIWNMAADECRAIGGTVMRWNNNDAANVVGSILNKIGNFRIR